MQSSELDIARNIKALEMIKIELLDNLAALFKALLKGSSDKIVDILALIIINCFLLAKRMGLNFGRLDIQIYDRTKTLLKEGHNLEEWYGDISALKAYLEIKR